VVIWDRTHSKTEIGDGYTKNEGIIDIIYDDAFNVTDVQYYNMNPAPDSQTCAEAIAADLEDQGYTVKRIYTDSGDFKFDVVKGNVEYTFTWDPSDKTEMVEITVNGKKVFIDETVTTMAAVAAAGGVKSADQGKWVDTKMSGTAAWKAVNATSMTLAEGDTFNFGYYKVTASTSAVSNSSPATNKGGDSTVSAPAAADAVQYVKANAMNINFELTLTAATTGVVEVGVNNGTVTKGQTMASGMKVGDKHEVTVALTADQVKSEPTVTLTLADRTSLSVTVGGVTKTFDAGSKITDALTAFGVTYGEEGTYAKQTVGTTDTYVAVSNSTALADGATYEFGYYKVTMPTTGTAVNSVTFTVTDSGAQKYVKKNETFDLTITMSGTEDGTGNTKADFTVSNATMTDGTVTATSGANGTAAVSGNNKLTVNATASVENTSVFTVTVTVTGAGDVTFS
jgi:hypothetical protein